MSRKRVKVAGPWIPYEWVPGKWVEVKKKDVTGLVTSRKIGFCPHCGDKILVSRRFGVIVAGIRHEFTEGTGMCKGCGQSFSVLPRFLKIPGILPP